MRGPSVGQLDRHQGFHALESPRRADRNTQSPSFDITPRDAKFLQHFLWKCALFGSGNRFVAKELLSDY
jgi:hypothetical protein